jgi:hypothetical protein
MRSDQKLHNSVLAREFFQRFLDGELAGDVPDTVGLYLVREGHTSTHARDSIMPAPRSLMGSREASDAILIIGKRRGTTCPGAVSSPGQLTIN